MWAWLSLVLTYALEPSLGRAYFKYFFDPTSFFQHWVSSVVRIIHGGIPYSWLHTCLAYAIQLSLGHLQSWLSESLLYTSVHQWLETLWITQTLLPGFGYLSWATSTFFSALFRGIAYYFEHVTDPDLRFLFAALLALVAYQMLVLGVWFWTAKITIRVNVKLLRKSVDLATKLLGMITEALLSLQVALFALLGLSHWLARILSILVIFLVDRVVWAVHETQGHQSMEADAEAHELQDEETIELSPWISRGSRPWYLRRLLVSIYMFWLVWTSWMSMLWFLCNVANWFLRFRLMRWVAALVRVFLTTYAEILLLFATMLCGGHQGIAKAVAHWLLRFRPACFAWKHISRILRLALRIARPCFRVTWTLLRPFVKLFWKIWKKLTGTGLTANLDQQPETKGESRDQEAPHLHTQEGGGGCQSCQRLEQERLELKEQFRAEAQQRLNAQQQRHRDFPTSPTPVTRYNWSRDIGTVSQPSSPRQSARLRAKKFPDDVVDFHEL